MLALIVALALSADPSPVKLASPTLTGVNMTSDELNFYTDHLAQQLGFVGLRVTTPSEIAQLIGFERQRQLLGCTAESSSCMAELANALGVDGIVTGSIGKVGKSYQVNLKIINAADGTPLAAYSARAKEEEELLDVLTAGAQQMGRDVLRKLNRAAVKQEPKEQTLQTPPKENKPEVVESKPAEPSAPSTGMMRKVSFVPMGVGVVLAAVGTYMIVGPNGNGVKDKIAASTDPNEIDTLAKNGVATQNTGAALIGVGAAAVAGGVVMYALGAPKDTSVALLPGALPTVVFAGHFDVASVFAR